MLTITPVSIVNTKKNNLSQTFGVSSKISHCEWKGINSIPLEDAIAAISKSLYSCKDKLYVDAFYRNIFTPECLKKYSKKDIERVFAALLKTLCPELEKVAPEAKIIGKDKKRIHLEYPHKKKGILNLDKIEHIEGRYDTDDVLKILDVIDTGRYPEEITKGILSYIKTTRFTEKETGIVMRLLGFLTDREHEQLCEDPQLLYKFFQKYLKEGLPISAQETSMFPPIPVIKKTKISLEPLVKCEPKSISRNGLTIKRYSKYYKEVMIPKQFFVSWCSKGLYSTTASREASKELYYQLTGNEKIEKNFKTVVSGCISDLIKKHVPLKALMTSAGERKASLFYQIAPGLSSKKWAKKQLAIVGEESIPVIVEKPIDILRVEKFKKRLDAKRDIKAGGFEDYCNKIFSTFAEKYAVQLDKEGIDSKIVINVLNRYQQGCKLNPLELEILGKINQVIEQVAPAN